jgi:hypothetical protein
MDSPWLPYAEPDEWIDEPSAATRRALDEARADLDAGRYVICDGVEAFSAFLDGLDASPAGKSTEAAYDGRRAAAVRDDDMCTVLSCPPSSRSVASGMTTAG